MTTITISGSPGSGKTTIAKLLEKKLGLKYVYSGDIFRNMAKKYNMSLEEFGSYCEKHKNADEQLDRYQLKILQKGDVIVEGRIAGWLAYRNNIFSTKILLEADLEARASRIVKREKGRVEKRKKEILKRENSEATRYKKYYDIDIDDTSIYDLVIDTSNKTPDEIVELIIKEIKE
ncbi:MAG: cytidylate kinase family protein [Thermoplasmatales archaeon]|nr:MAG: cytidylate kinase family protein [Thermoplasmatales archaeon]